MSAGDRIQSYLFRHLARQADAVAEHRPELAERWLRRIEEEGYLARQAEAAGSFEAGMRDLEEHLVPHLVARRDGPRFVRYLLVAINLRDLATSLDSPRLLRTLAVENLPFARHLAGGHADPLLRARARAEVAAGLTAAGRSYRPELGALVEELKADLDAAAPTAASPAAWLDALEAVARSVGLAVRGRWDEWIGALPPAAADRLRRTLAEVFLDGGDAAGGWAHLRAVGDRRRRTALLRARPELLDDLAFAPALRRLDELSGPGREGDAAFWCAVPALLLRRAADGEPAALFAAACRRRPVAWNLDVVDAGAAWWRRLPWNVLQELDSEILSANGGWGLGGSAAEVRAALWTAVADRGDGELEAAAAAVDALRGAVPWVRWSLRWIEASPRRLEARARRRFEAVGSELARLRFAVAAADLRRFLDLAARLDRRHLDLWIEDVLWGPEADADLLLALADGARRDEVLRALLRRAESYAVTAAADEAAGFELRRRLLSRLACRLCRRHGDLSPLADVVPRLLPEEEDEVREEVAAELADDLPQLAAAASAGIRSSRRRRRARLDLLPALAAPAGLAPADLYAAVASVEEAEDEVKALAALFAAPLEPRRLARERLAELHRPARRIAATADLVRHALAFEAAALPPAQRDPLTCLLPLQEALGVVESDRWLATVTPDLAQLGARLGGGSALAELREAVERVVALEAVPWETRLEVLGRLLGCGDALLLGETPGRLGCWRAARWYRGLLRLPAALPRAAAETQRLRRRWPGLLPRIVAAAERSPPAVRRLLRRELPEAGLLPPLSRLGVRSGVRNGVLDGTPAHRGIGAAVERQRRRWKLAAAEVGAAQAEALDLCCALPEERLRRARELLRGDGAPGPVVEALVWLLAAAEPRLASALLARLPAARRDRQRLGLLLAGILTRAARQEWRQAMADPALRRRAELWTQDDPGPPPLAATLAAVAAGEVDLDDPRWDGLRRRLWSLDEEDLPRLALAALAALRDHGATAGMAGLRLWLNARLAPTPGRPQGDDALRRAGELRAAVAAARTITS